jgi:hypothetical protein
MCAVAPALYWYLLVSVALFASGRADRMLRWALIEAVITAIFGLAGARFGLVGLAAAGVLRLYVMMPLGWYWLRHDVGVNPRRLLTLALPSLAASVVMAVIVALAKSQLAPLLGPPMLSLSLVAVGIATYAMLLPVSAKHLLSQVMFDNNQERTTMSGKLVDGFVSALVRMRIIGVQS